MRPFLRLPELQYRTLLQDKITLPLPFSERYDCKVSNPAESRIVEEFRSKKLVFDATRYRDFMPEDNMSERDIRAMTNFIIMINDVDIAFHDFIAAAYNKFNSLESVIYYYSPQLYSDLFNLKYPAEDVLMTKMKNYMIERYPAIIER